MFSKHHHQLNLKGRTGALTSKPYPETSDVSRGRSSLRQGAGLPETWGGATWLRPLIPEPRGTSSSTGDQPPDLCSIGQRARDQPPDLCSIGQRARDQPPDLCSIGQRARDQPPDLCSIGQRARGQPPDL
ncbi:hypothetical protein NHX12_014958 [Muraenolepis orangiensis]|uniref:Uncharacterized protein n=1 Tax=Muraenolepis orangiensis TaxID=630683 RepID=A0A9Q0DBA5_9TELE|nr:hypothetical protein NHX12_014958 [Muraenolepis orangiensis]